MASCVDSSRAEHSVPPSDGGSTPTSTLQLRKRDWTVAGATKDRAEELIAAHHYAGGAANTFVALHGLYPAGWRHYHECVGVAWWMPPIVAAARAWAGDEWQGVLALSRLAIEPDVPSNACSFLLSKSVRGIPPQWHTLVSYADTWRGHTGAIYRAAGWEYCGMTEPSPVWMLDGKMVARKSGPKTRTKAEMIELGAVCVGTFAKARYCLRRASALKVAA